MTPAAPTDTENCEAIIGVLDGPDAWGPEARRLLAALVQFGPPGEGVVYRQPAERDLEDKREGMRAKWTQEGAARASALHTWKEVALALGVKWPPKMAMPEVPKVAEARAGLMRAIDDDAALAEAERLRAVWCAAYPGPLGVKAVKPWAMVEGTAKIRWLGLARDSLARRSR